MSHDLDLCAWSGSITTQLFFSAVHSHWAQNIAIHEITPGTAFPLSDRLSATALLLPHRNEFADTAPSGFYTPQPYQSAALGR